MEDIQKSREQEQLENVFYANQIDRTLSKVPHWSLYEQLEKKRASGFYDKFVTDATRQRIQQRKKSFAIA